GAYVTDGTTNVTIPKGQTPDDITYEIAVQMLADKRAKGPAPKRTTRRAARCSWSTGGPIRACRSR
ncbi:MAG TPA: topoisomerase C-terminal repeat-containing protein, partial [Acidimicrobiales bacterium]|nr:topoisomerase C-terminal repeat-containing protein [Acidimicrobiales bacterium]